MVTNSKIIRVAPEFEDLLQREIIKMRKELEMFYGIKLTKTKASGILARRIQEKNGGNGFL